MHRSARLISRRSALWELLEFALLTVALVLGGDPLAFAVTLVDALVLSTDHFGASARAADRCSITEVGVDANQVRGQAKGPDILDNDFTGRLLAVVGAVTARAVELTGIDDGVVADGNTSRTTRIASVTFHRLEAREAYLCWTTLSIAFCAPPPTMRESPGPRMEIASSQTSRNQTLVRLQEPKQ